MSIARGLLVTGTDTGIGKTFVASALAAALGKRLRVAVFKPAETGCPELGGELQPRDALRLREAAGSDERLDLICPYRYSDPLAPWVAAERAGQPIEMARLRDCFSRLASSAEVVLVESAGGLLVPLTQSHSFAELAAELELPVLLVVGSRLGALNQALLTLECARRRGLVIRGYVLNQLSAQKDLAQTTNPRALERLTDAECLASFPWIPHAAELSRSDLAELGAPLAGHF